MASLGMQAQWQIAALQKLSTAFEKWRERSEKILQAEVAVLAVIIRSVLKSAIDIGCPKRLLKK